VISTRRSRRSVPMPLFNPVANIEVACLGHKMDGGQSKNLSVLITQSGQSNSQMKFLIATKCDRDTILERRHLPSTNGLDIKHTSFEPNI
jgi:hypothetical protein